METPPLIHGIGSSSLRSIKFPTRRVAMPSRQATSCSQVGRFLESPPLQPAFRLTYPTVVVHPTHYIARLTLRSTHARISRNRLLRTKTSITVPSSREPTTSRASKLPAL